METIEGFRGQFGFLSNFMPFDTPLEYQGLLFQTNEHFYQAMKFKDYGMRCMIAEHPSRGLKGFVRQNELLIRADWHDIKLDVMEFGLRYKFSEQNPKCRQRLIETQGIKLVEYNTWGDYFWGADMHTRYGQNNLGKLLMKIRDEILEG